MREKLGSGIRKNEANKGGMKYKRQMILIF